jgi:hypothetical protein
MSNIIDRATRKQMRKTAVFNHTLNQERIAKAIRRNQHATPPLAKWGKGMAFLKSIHAEIKAARPQLQAE